MLKFDTSAFGGEVPVRLGVTDIAVVLPGGDFVDERLFVGNAAVEALGGKDAKFGFEATTTLDRKDFGIVWNKTLDTGGYMLGDDVIVSINLEAGHKKEAASN